MCVAIGWTNPAGLDSEFISAPPPYLSIVMRSGWVDKSGKNVAFAKMELILKESGKVAATGEHHQFFPPGVKPVDPANLSWNIGKSKI